MPPKKKNRGVKLSPVGEVSTNDSPEKEPNVQKEQENVQQKDRNTIEEDAEFDAIEQAEIPRPKLTPKQKQEKIVRDSVTASFRHTFQARSHFVDCIKQSTQQLLSSYGKTRKNKGSVSKEIFFNELDIRLCMMIEKVSVIEHRARVFKVCCEAACCLFTEAEDTSIIKFLISFFETWSKSNDVEARTNIASFIGFLLESGLSRRTSDSSYLLFDMTYTRKLYILLLALIKDQPAVRVAAIRSVSVIQGLGIPSDFEEAVEITPKELLVRSFRDISWECRLAAIEVFEPQAEYSGQIVKLALYDKCVKVRCVALEKFAKLLLKNTDAMTKMDILYTCLNDHDISIRESVRKSVIEYWLKRLAKAYCDSLENSESDEIIETDATGRPMIENKDEKKTLGYGYAAQLISVYITVRYLTPEVRKQVHFVMMHVLDVCRKLSNVHLEPIEHFAETLVEDLVETDLQILTRANFLDIIEPNYQLEIRVNKAFFWYILVDYLHERGHDSNDRLLAIERIVPKMVRMIELVEEIEQFFAEMEETRTSYRKTYETEQEWEDCVIHQMSIYSDVFSIFRYLDKAEPGLSMWKQLLNRFLIKNINTPKRFVDIIVQDLMQNFYAESPKDMLADISSLVSDTINRLTHGDDTMMNETVSIANSKPTKITTQQHQLLLEVYSYELMVMNSVLKTGMLTTICPILKTKYENLILPRLASEDVEERILAMECGGIVGMLDLNFIEKGLIACAELASRDSLTVKTLFVVMIVDLCVAHGRDDVQAILNKRPSVNRKRVEEEDVIDILCEYILSDDPEIKNSEIVLRSCEGLGKLLLHSTVDPDNLKWKKAIVTLISRLNYKFDGKFAAKLRSVITTLLKFFASLSRNNQKLLIGSFVPFFEEWDNNQTLQDNAGDQDYLIRRLVRIAALFAILTRHSLLLSTDKKQKPVHIEFLLNALRELANNPDSTASNFYIEVIQWIEVESFPKVYIEGILEELDEAIKEYEYGTRKDRLSQLKKLSKKLSKQAGPIDRHVEEVSHESHDFDIKREPIERATPAPIEATPAPTRARNARSTRKTPATIQKNVEDELRDLMDSPVNETVTKKNPKPRAQPTSERPKRAARRLNPK